MTAAVADLLLTKQDTDGVERKLTLAQLDTLLSATTKTLTNKTISGATGITSVGTITTGVWTGTDIAVADGGTGASTAAAARTNLGALGTTGLSSVEFIRKAADETIDTSSTLQNDDDFVVALAASEVVAFELVLFINSGSTPDFKFAFTVPSGAVLTWGIGSSVMMNTSETAVGSATETASGTAIALAGQAARRLVTVSGLVVNSTTAGNLQFQWAQNTSDAGSTKIEARSYMLVMRV